MAHIGNCPYCNGSVNSIPWHPNCRIMYLEGLLHELRKLAKVGADADLRTIFGRLTEMTIILHQENWRSKQDADKEARHESDLAQAETLRNLARQSAQQTFLARWESENPVEGFIPKI